MKNEAILCACPLLAFKFDEYFQKKSTVQFFRPDRRKTKALCLKSYEKALLSRPMMRMRKLDSSGS